MARYGPYDTELQPLNESDDEGRGGKSGGSSGGMDPCACMFLTCCCCCICVLPMVLSIGIAITSVGYTSCPAAQPLVNATSASALPAQQVLVTPYKQWNWFKENLVIDPQISQTAHIGKWRTTKTWYLRTQYAYVPEQSSVPVVVAWQPWYSWTRKFHLKRCTPLEETVLEQDIIWFSSWWGQKQKRWSILNTAGTKIASVDSSKAYNWNMFSVPNGWNSVVTSVLYPGVIIGSMQQSYSSYWTRDAVWTVNDTRPDLVQPYVLSFLAASIDLKAGNRRRGQRRLAGLSPSERDTTATEEEDS